MQIYEIDQTLSYTGESSSTVRELTLPGNIPFQGLMFRFDGIGASATGKLAAGFNNLKIQVSGQSPVTEVINENSLDNLTSIWTGLLVDRSITQNITNYSYADDVDDTNGNWFILPWSHSNKTPIKIIMDLDLSGAVFGATSGVTVKVGLVNAGVPTNMTYVLSREAFTSASDTENVNLPAWGADETVIVVDTANSITRISAPALGVNIDYPGLYGPNWGFTTNSGTDADDGFTKYLLEQNITPRTGADMLNLQKTASGVTGTVYYLKAVYC